MKILFINSFYYPNTNGGAEKVCRLMAESFSKNGDEVTVYTLDSMKHTEIINGVKVDYNTNIISKNRKKNCNNILINALIKFKRLFSIVEFVRLFLFLKKEKFDVINTHAIEDFSPSIWLAAKLNKCRVVHTIHDNYLVCHRLFFLNSKGYLCRKANFICKFRRRINILLEKNVEVFISPSNAIANNMPFKCAIIPNGVFVPNKVRINSYDVKRIKLLYVGGLNYHKGINVLLEAFKLLDENYELNIVGDGELYDNIYLLVKNQSRIKLHGWCDETQVSELLNYSNILIIPSICPENCPMVVLEAFVHRVPVIGSDYGGIIELIKDDYNGYLFNRMDYIDLYKKIMAVSNDKYNYFVSNINRDIYLYSLERQYENYYRVLNHDNSINTI